MERNGVSISPNSTAILLQHCPNIVRTIGAMLLYNIAPRLEMQIGRMLGQYWIAILNSKVCTISYNTPAMLLLYESSID